MTWAVVWIDRGQRQVATFLIEENAREYAERIGVDPSCVSWMAISDVPRSGPLEATESGYDLAALRDMGLAAKEGQ